jgi:hypothetical protein
MGHDISLFWNSLMFNIKSNPAPAVLTGLFWDAFAAADAIAALIRDGFSECEIEALGVLCGRAPDLTDLLLSMGVKRERAIFCNDCFADGAVLLIVRTESGRRARIALNTLRRGEVRARKEVYEHAATLSGQKRIERRSHHAKA